MKITIRTTSTSHIIYDASVFLYILSLALINGSSLFQYVVIFVSAVLCIRLIMHKCLPVSSFILLMLLFILYGVLHTFIYITSYHDASVSRIITTIYNFIVNYLMFSYLIDSDNKERTNQSIIISGLILAGYLLLSNAQAFFTLGFKDNIPYLFGLTGSNGKHLNTNGIARFFALTVFAWILRYKHDKRFYIARIAELVFIGWSLLATGSRGGILLTFLFLLVWMIFNSKKPGTVFIRLLGVIAIAYLAIIVITKNDLLYNSFGYRFESLINGLKLGISFGTGTTEAVRYGMAKYAYNMFVQKPIFGWGLDSFASLHMYKLPSHNNYLELLASLGIIGFLLYYSAIFVLIKDLIREIRKKTTIDATVELAFFVAICIMSVSAVDYFERITIFFFYYVAASCYGYKRSFLDENGITSLILLHCE